MRIAIIGLVGAGTLVLAGCSGGDEPTPTSNSAEPTTVIESPSPTTDDPSIGNADDPLCAAAGDNLDEAVRLEAKTQELTDMMQDPAFLTDSDPTELNQWGEDLLALTEGTKSFYDLGVSETAGEDINADFVLLGDFVDNYTTALGTAAAEAETSLDFLDAIQELITDSDVREMLQAVPDAATNVAAYLGERCDITG